QLLLLPSADMQRAGQRCRTPRPTADRVLSARSACITVRTPDWITSCEKIFWVSQSLDREEPERRVERVLEEGLERVETPQAARAVVARLERLSRGHTEEERGTAAARTAGEPSAAAQTIEQAAAATTEKAV